MNLAEIQKILVTTYLFSITEEMFLVPFEIFIKDFLKFCEVKSKVDLKALEESQIIDDLFTPFAKILMLASQTIFELTRWTIIRSASNWDEYLVKSYVLNDFLKSFQITHRS